MGQAEGADMEGVGIMGGAEGAGIMGSTEGAGIMGRDKGADMEVAGIMGRAEGAGIVGRVDEVMEITGLVMVEVAGAFLTGGGSRTGGSGC